MTREEAIKIIKSITVYTLGEMQALETLIPELRESEDERIRKDFEEAVADLIEKAKQGKCDSLSPIEEGNKLLAIAKHGKVNQQEWSEEDEKAAYFINQFLEYYEASDPTAKSCKEWFNNRFKSLRQQSKPIRVRHIG